MLVKEEMKDARINFPGIAIQKMGALTKAAIFYPQGSTMETGENFDH